MKNQKVPPTKLYDQAEILVQWLVADDWPLEDAIPEAVDFVCYRKAPRGVAKALRRQLQARLG
jgi:hypothetical protein